MEEASIPAPIRVEQRASSTAGAAGHVGIERDRHPIPRHDRPAQGGEVAGLLQGGSNRGPEVHLGQPGGPVPGINQPPGGDLETLTLVPELDRDPHDGCLASEAGPRPSGRGPSSRRVMIGRVAETGQVREKSVPAGRRGSVIVKRLV